MNGRRLNARHLLLLPCLLLFAGYASAGIYEWKDAGGTVHFSDAPQATSQQARSNAGAGHDGMSNPQGLSPELIRQQKARQKAQQEAEQEIEQEVEQETPPLTQQQAQQEAAQKAEQKAEPKTKQKAQLKKVVMYSTSWCPYCKQARAYFKQKGIQYTDYDIEDDLDAAQRYRQMKGRGVPLILVGNHGRMNGWSAQHFNRLYYHGDEPGGGQPLAVRAVLKLQQFSRAIDKFLSGSTTQSH